MTLIDEMTIYLQAGKGGDGVVRWRHEKYKEFAGPGGGCGGRGGGVYAKAVRDITRLNRYSRFRQLSAEDGQPGGNNNLTGRNGEDLIVEMPVGTLITNTVTGEEFDLTEEGQTQELLSGGAGGFGNESFKSSRNVSPTQWTAGQPGEGANFKIELRLMADAGLIGLPSAGKSSLLNELTRAQSKVGNYPFTTLEPHLGDLHGLILADIPGLIEGAAEGKGLGHRFLRHIKRTNILLHCLSLEESDKMVENYQQLRQELGEYDKELLNKPEWIILTKTDTVSGDVVAAVQKEMNNYSDTVLAVSVLDDDSLKRLKEQLVNYFNNN